MSSIWQYRRQNSTTVHGPLPLEQLREWFGEGCQLDGVNDTLFRNVAAPLEVWLTRSEFLAMLTHPTAGKVPTPQPVVTNERKGNTDHGTLTPSSSQALFRRVFTGRAPGANSSLKAFCLLNSEDALFAAGPFSMADMETLGEHGVVTASTQVCIVEKEMEDAWFAPSQNILYRMVAPLRDQAEELPSWLEEEVYQMIGEDAVNQAVNDFELVACAHPDDILHAKPEDPTVGAAGLPQRLRRQIHLQAIQSEQLRVMIASAPRGWLAMRGMRRRRPRKWTCPTPSVTPAPSTIQSPSVTAPQTPPISAQASLPQAFMSSTLPLPSPQDPHREGSLPTTVVNSSVPKAALQPSGPSVFVTPAKEMKQIDSAPKAAVRPSASLTFVAPTQDAKQVTTPRAVAGGEANRRDKGLVANAFSSITQPKQARQNATHAPVVPVTAQVVMLNGSASQGQQPQTAKAAPATGGFAKNQRQVLKEDNPFSVEEDGCLKEQAPVGMGRPWRKDDKQKAAAARVSAPAAKTKNAKCNHGSCSLEEEIFGCGSADDGVDDPSVPMVRSWRKEDRKMASTGVPAPGGPGSIPNRPWRKGEKGGGRGRRRGR